MKKLLPILISLMMCMPCAVFGAEVDENTSGDAVEPTAEQAVNEGDVSVDENTSGDEVVEETVDTEAEEPEPAREIKELLVVHNSKGKETTIGKLPDSSYDGFIYSLKDDTAKADIGEMKENIETLDSEQTVDTVKKNEMYVADSLETIEEVVDPETVEIIEPNYVRHLDSWTKEGSYNKKNNGNYQQIDVDLLWDHGVTANGVKVAVIDSGVVGLKGGKIKHQDLNYSKISAGPTYATKTTGVPYSTTYANDDNGHGTFVTGEIASRLGNKKGVAGLASGVEILSLKVADKKGAVDDADIISALYEAAAQNVQVANMSLSGYNYSSQFETVCNEMANRGMILVAAAGNDGDTDYTYPASYNNVISVGAVDEYGDVTDYSQHNSKVDCVAPGDYYGISSKGKSKYRFMDGTSMACPIVTSYAAIIKSYNPSWNVSKIRSVIQSTSTDKGASGKDNYYGYGIVNFRNMYHYISNTWLYPKEGTSLANMIAKYEDYDYYYSGKEIQPLIKFTGLTLDTDYTLTYSANCVDVGTVKITATGIGNYKGKITRSFKIVPKGTSLVSLSGGTGTLTIGWNEQTTQTSGYQVRYCYLNSKGNLTKWKTKTITNNTATSLTIKKLSHNKYYFVQVRTYKKVGKSKYYSPWSDYDYTAVY